MEGNLGGFSLKFAGRFTCLLALFPLCGLGSELCSDSVPKFKNTIPQTATIQAGQFAYLTCEIHCLNNRSVSWVRGRDGHIIAVEQELFIQDKRFQSLHEKDQWTLLIRNVEAGDAGKYECQVSTVPKQSRQLELIVVVPKVRIFGHPAIYVQEGSSVQLECVVSQALEAPKYILWEFNGQGIGGSTYNTIDTTTTTSVLSLNRLGGLNAGKYSCIPAQLPPATVDLFVLDGNGQYVVPVIGQNSSNRLGHSLVRALVIIWLNLMLFCC